MIMNSSHFKYIGLTEVEGLSARTVNTLARAKIWTIGDLVDFYNSIEKLKRIHGLGAAGVNEIKNSIPLLYPGYLGLNNSDNNHEVDVDCLEIVAFLEKTIESQKTRIEELEWRVDRSHEMKSELAKRIIENEKTIIELRQKLRSYTGKDNQSIMG